MIKSVKFIRCFGGLIRRKNCFLLWELLLRCCFPLQTLPHHGFAGRYDEDHPVTVTGTVVELQFQNPHSFIIFENKDAGGKDVRWQAELGSANLMAREGWTRTMLKAGDRITIIGPQNKNGSADLNLSHAEQDRRWPIAAR